VGIEGVFPRTLFYIGSMPIKDSVFYTWVIILGLVAASVVGYRRYRAVNPPGWQVAIEFAMDYVDSLVTDAVGKTLPQTVPYLTAMLVYIAVCNLMGLVPLMRSPTRDINTTAALSIISFLSTEFYGAQHRGIKAQLLSHFEPMVLLFPLNLIGSLSRILSMALRLFGNVIAGEIVGATIFMLVPVLAPLPLNLLGMITGVLQALVFTVLTISFIGDAMRLDD
jgi:F-type H+-transporting ATPase subunit a